MIAKKAKNVSLALIMSSLFLFAQVCIGAQTTAEKTAIQEAKQEVEDAAQAIKKYSADQRDEAVKKVKAALDALDVRIDSIETRIENRWDQMDQAARQQVKDSLQDLRKHRKEVAEWYGGLKHGSADAWEHVKKGFSESYTALHGAWEKAKKILDTGQ